MGQIFVRGIGLVNIAGDTPTAAEANAIAQAQTSQTQLGPLASAGLGAVQGATFNFGDELYGLAAGLIPGGQTREQAQQAFRDSYARADPLYAIPGELGGAVATSFIPGLGGANVARAGTAAARLGRAAVTGAGQGAVAGFGAGEGGLGNRIEGAAGGAMTGAALGGAAEATLGRLARPRASQALPGAQAADELGIPLTRGQRTGDVEQLSREAELVGTRGPGGDTVRNFYENVQDPAIQRAIGDIGRQVGDDSLQNAATDAVGALKAAERAGKRGIDDAYDAVTRLDGEIIDKGAFAALTKRFDGIINDDVQGFGLNPEVGDFLTGVAKRVAEAGGKGKPTIQRLEGMRKGMNSVWKNQTDPARRAGVGALKEAFDDWMVDTIQKGLYRGDPQTLDVLKNARALNTEYQRLFGVGGKTPADKSAGRMIQQLIDDNAGADEAIRFINGLQSIGAPGAKRALRRIEQVSPEAFAHVRAAHFQDLVTNRRTGEALTPNQIATNIERLTAKQPEIARIIYGPEVVRQLHQLRTALRVTDRNLRGAGNVSRSGYAAANLITGFARSSGLAAGIAGNPGIAFATLLAEGFSNIGRTMSANRAVSQTLPAAGDGLLAGTARRAAGQIGRISPSLNSAEPFGGGP